MLGLTMHHGHEIGWTFNPLLVVPLLAALLVYLIGLARLSRRASARPAGVGLFLSGWMVLTLALVSPLHEGGERSFTLHMIEHELIMLVSTLFLAMSSSGGIMAWGLPRPLRARGAARREGRGR